VLLAPSYTLPLARALSAALLTLALLSSIVPVAVLSSSHSCAMPCCAGAEGGCATGACEGALFRSPKKERKEEKLCGSEEAYKSHGAKSGSKAADAPFQEDRDHCDSEGGGSIKGGAKATRAPSRKVAVEGERSRIYAGAMAAPCARDCCAAASPSAQSRRGRDSALCSLSGRSTPVDFASLSLYLLNLQPERGAHLKRLRSRAPPRIPSSSLT